MVRFVRETAVAAPFDDVWAVHDRLDGFATVTPDRLGVSVVPLDGPMAPLEAGTTFEIAVDPVGLGRITIWRGRVTSVRRRPDRARFVDVGVETPFVTWRHVHTVKRRSEGTVVVDDITVRGPPAGPLGQVAIRLGVPLGLRDRRHRLWNLFGRVRAE